MISKILASSTPKTVAEYKTAIEQMIAEMQQINQQMQHDQADIDRLTAETAILKAETRALLARMGAPV